MKLRILPSVPKPAVNIAYIQSNTIGVGENISLVDLSREREANRALAGEFNVADGSSIDTDNIEVSTRSMVRRDRGEATPLWYTYRIGRGRYYLTHDSALPGDPEGARLLILAAIQIIRPDGTGVSGVSWDIDTPTFVVGRGWEVDLYLDRQSTNEEVLLVRYDGFDLYAASSVKNRTETINSVTITNTITNTWNGVGYTISGVSTNRSPAIALFSTIISPPLVTITTTSVTIGANVITIGPGIPVRDVVASINALEAGLQVRILNTSDDSSMEVGVYTPSVYGEIVLFSALSRIRYKEDARIRARRPYPLDISNSWYPRITNGVFRETRNVAAFPITSTFSGETDATLDLEFRVAEFDSQVWGRAGKPYKDVLTERPKFVSPNSFRVARTPIKSVSDVRIFLNGTDITGQLKDVDLKTGTVFLTRMITDTQFFRVDYVYKEEDYVYNDLNLNPLPAHNPELPGKYVALFMIPSKMTLVTTGQVSVAEFSKTVYHTYGGTYQEALDLAQVSRWKDSTSGDRELDIPVLILGVFRVVQSQDVKEDVDFVDSRTRGGGIIEMVNPENLESKEARMLWDVGYWDGEPLSANSVVVAEMADIRNIGDDPTTLDVVPATGEFYGNPSGRLSTQEIDEILSRHSAAGTLFITRFEQ